MNEKINLKKAKDNFFLDMIESILSVAGRTIINCYYYYWFNQCVKINYDIFRLLYVHFCFLCTSIPFFCLINYYIV